MSGSARLGLQMTLCRSGSRGSELMLQRARRLGGVREKVESPDDAAPGRQQGGTNLELARSSSNQSVQQHP